MHEEIEEILKRFDDPVTRFYDIEALTAESGFLDGSFHSDAWEAALLQAMERNERWLDEKEAMRNALSDERRSPTAPHPASQGRAEQAAMSAGTDVRDA